jgi:pyrroloquinoline-quinone synthase
MVTTPKAFLRTIDKEIAGRSLLKHEFYEMWNKGTLTLDHLRGYAREYYHHEVAYPLYLSAVHTNSPDLSTRQVLLENLIEEERGDDNHAELWLRFCDALSMQREAVTDAKPLATTCQLVNVFREICEDRPYYEGVAALYAFESQIPEVAKTKAAGLRKWYGVNGNGALQFFTVHQEADVWHSEAERSLMEKAAGTARGRDGMTLAVDRSLHSLYGFLDGVMDHYVS